MLDYGSVERSVHAAIGDLPEVQDVSDIKSINIIEMMLPFSIMPTMVCLCLIILLFEFLHRNLGQ